MGWDRTLNGNPLDNDSFLWILNAQPKNNLTYIGITMKGSLTLLR
jgi:hypothetical protein